MVWGWLLFFLALDLFAVYIIRTRSSSITCVLWFPKLLAFSSRILICLLLDMSCKVFFLSSGDCVVMRTCTSYVFVCIVSKSYIDIVLPTLLCTFRSYCFGNIVVTWRWIWTLDALQYKGNTRTRKCMCKWNGSQVFLCLSLTCSM